MSTSVALRTPGHDIDVGTGMYEAFLGLQRRPFAATPDPQCWYAGGPYQAALDELVVCAEQGQGIAILVAPAGAGKTILCERLVRELSPRFDTVHLRHSTFNTRRSLLQTLLCEMEQPFDKPTDQELRLGLAPVLRRLHQLGRALVLIVDEAHLLSETLLEELRILSDHAQDGKPLIRLILVGQPVLEEKLVHPSMQALNHRVRAQVALSPLTRQETADYLDYRFTWAGGRTEELLTGEAMDLVCQAADGLPRCVNQLCDHALLLAFAGEEQPVTAEHVAAALEDLKHLPLPWNPIPQPHPRTSSITTVKTPEEPASAAIEWDSEECEPATTEATTFMAMAAPMDDESPTLPAYRLSAHLEVPDGESAELLVFADTTPPAWDAGHRAAPTPSPAPTVSSTQTSEFIEEVVIDRYTALDAGLTPPEPPAVPVIETSAEPPARFTRREDAPVPVFSDQDVTWNAALAQLSQANEIDERLNAVQAVLNAAQQTDVKPLPVMEVETPDSPEELSELCVTDDVSEEEAIGTTVLEIMDETRRELAPPAPSAESAVFEFGSDEPATTPQEMSAAPEPRRYRHLFTMLRRKQQGRA